MKTVVRAMALVACLVSGLSLLAANDAYVESTVATQYVNTGYCIGPNTRVELDFQLTEVPQNQARLFGSGDPAQRMDCYVGSAASTPGYCFSFLQKKADQTTNEGKNLVGAPVDMARHTAIFDKATRHVAILTDGEVTDEATLSTSVSSVSAYPLALFGEQYNAEGTKFSYFTLMKVYGLKIYESGELVRNFVPALEGGLAGLYDTLTKSFIFDTREASQKLAYGGDILDLDGDAPYVASPDGNVSLLTDYYPNFDTRIECDYALIATNHNQYLFTSSGKFYMRGYIGQLGKSQNYLSSDSWALCKTVNSLVIASDGARRTLTIDAPGDLTSLVTAGFTNYTAKITALTNFYNCGESASTGALRIFSSASGTSGYVKMRLYGFRIYEKGELVRDYRPMSMDGIGILKDAVTGSWLKSTTATDLTYGGAIEECDDGYLESDGTQGVNLGYKLTPASRVVVDFRYTKTGLTANSPLLGCAVPNGTAKMCCGISQNGSGNFEFCLPFISKDYTTRFSGSISAVDTKRHVATIDVRNSTVILTRNGSAQWSRTSPSNLTESATYPLGLFGSTKETNGAFYPTVRADGINQYCAPVRIYSVKIYENDALAKHWVPFMHNGELCLKELVGGTFLGFRDTNNRGLNNSPKAGGKIGYDEGCTPYVESDGTQYMNLGVYVTTTSRIETVFAMCGTTNGYQTVFGNGASKGDLPVAMRVNKSGNFEGLIGNKWSGGHFTMDFEKHVWEIDLSAKTSKITNPAATGGTSTATKGDATVTKDGTVPVGAFAFLNSADGKTFADPSKSRIFSIRIFEGETLAHEFLPYKGAKGTGFYDTKTGEVVTKYRADAAEPTVYGVGDGFLIAPSASVSVPVDESVTVNCLAIGANSYKWYLDGEEIPGETGETLTIPWRRVRSHQAVVSVRPVWRLYGNEVLGEAQDIDVEYQPLGCAMIIR